MKLIARFKCLSYSKKIDANEDEDVDNALSLFEKKAKARKGKRPRRRPRWCPKVLDDFIDIAVNSNEFKNKLIFTNTKNQRNSPIYAKILDEMKGRASARDDEFNMSIAQLRTKFKKCVSQCKQAALTHDNDNTQEVMKLNQEAVRNDPTKEMISFF